MADQRLRGAIGSVVRPIRGGRVPGEIRILDGGEPVLLLAYASDPLDVGVRVQIVHSRGSRQVDVTRWP